MLQNFSNHDIVKFLESIGAEFGACQNAYTSADETVFELVVPTDDDSSLSTAMSVFSEFATKIRCVTSKMQLSEACPGILLSLYMRAWLPATGGAFYRGPSSGRPLWTPKNSSAVVHGCCGDL